MKHDEFIGQVQQYAELSSQDEAERAARATLETLAERLPDDEAKDLASQLPPELEAYMQPGLAHAGETFSVHEFSRRVCLRGDVSPGKAVTQARAVIQALDEADSTHGVIDHVRTQLPEDFNLLFQ